MIIFKHAPDLVAYLEKQRAAGKTIGFVPTMGALHPGHISLITISKKETSLTVCSIFVNPTQFNDPKDFQKYPITIEKDIVLLEKAGADILFLPEVGELYPTGTKGLEHYDLGPLETILEGEFRPGHFQGVAQVMQRLLNMVRPDDLFMGSKDYQQCMVVQRLIQLMGLPTTLHRCPIIREPDGLAMSSRNVRLDPEQRPRSVAIYKTLKNLQAAWRALPNSDYPTRPIAVLVAKATEALESAHFRVDYVTIADRDTLQPAAEGSDHPVALIAAFMGEVRLIDNMEL